jgi:GT2 family glycosyltransferase
LSATHPPHVAVVVVNYRRADDTLECLDSILGSTGVRLELILVDNGSGDGSAGKMRSVFPQIELLELPKNLGFAGGYNTGIERSLAGEAEYVFLFNNDTALDPGCILSLVEAGWDVGVPKILYYSQTQRIWAAGCRWRSFPPSVVMIGLDQPDGPEYSWPQQLEYATGCALLFQRHVLEALPGFDRELENYMEDYDF